MARRRDEGDHLVECGHCDQVPGNGCFRCGGSGEFYLACAGGCPDCEVCKGDCEGCDDCVDLGTDKGESI